MGLTTAITTTTLLKLNKQDRHSTKKKKKKEKNLRESLNVPGVKWDHKTGFSLIWEELKKKVVSDFSSR